MSNTRAETARSSSSSPSSRISSASRLSISVQLVDGPHDVHARARVGREPLREPVHVGARVVEQAVGLERQPAAALLGDLDRDAVVLEQRDRHLAEPRLVVVGAAAVEERDACGRSPASCATAPSAGTSGPAKRGIGALWCRPTTLLGQQPQRAVGERPVRERGHRRPGLPGPRRPREDPVAQRHALRRLQRGACLRVDLGDVDALRADLGADPAAGAIVERRVRRRLVVDTEPLGLRAGVLRPGEQRRDRSRPGRTSRRSCT